MPTSSLSPLVRLGALLCAALLVLVAATPAGAARRQVPQGFLGMGLDGPGRDGTVPVEPEMALMARSGVESVRVSLDWFEAQPFRTAADVPADQRPRYPMRAGRPTNLSGFDALVEAAARHGLRVLPVLDRAPGWASIDPAMAFVEPRDPALYAAYARVLVGRYGPRGSFWAQHRELPRLPIRTWQIWNEPNLLFHWKQQPFAASYVTLLRAARRAIKGVDRGARIMLAGLPNESWKGLATVYAAGGRGLFDAVALHPYTREPANVVKIARLNRAVMDRNGDRRTPLVLTEMSWPSGKGKAFDALGIAVTESEQAQRVGQAYALLMRARRSLRLGGLYWYTWMSPDIRADDPFPFSGLRTPTGAGRARSKPALAAFARVARRLEGCAKGTRADRCR